MRIRSWGAIALGTTFALGTAAALFWDVRSVSDLTPDHMMTALVLVGTIASGHLFWHQLRHSALGCVGLALLFVAGTAYCVVTSAARNVEIGIPKALNIVASNERRRKLEAGAAEAQEDARKAKSAASKECAGGEGPRCRSLTKLADAADAHYWVLVARLANVKPEQPTNPGLRHAAQVFAALPFTGRAEDIEWALVQLMPFAKALFLEVATVVFLGLGIGQKTLTINTVSRPLIKVSGVSLIRRRLPLPATVLLETDQEAVLSALRKAGRPVTNDELAALMGVTKGEASKRTATLGNLIEKRRTGRYVAISLRKLN